MAMLKSFFSLLPPKWTDPHVRKLTCPRPVKMDCSEKFKDFPLRVTQFREIPAMATQSKTEDFVHGIIGNIPHNYHSSDLRNYFSQFIESGGFDCFHFRHRPEVKKTTKSCESDSASASASAAVSVSSECKRQENVKSKNSDSVKTTCCVVRLKADRMDELIKMYQRKHWLDSKGDSISQLCFVSRIKVASAAGTETSRYKTRAELRQVPGDREQLTQDDLRKLPELHPPVMMPNGNVGTPTHVFLDYIRDCKLPQTVIKKLGLQFPHSRRKRRYGNVSFDYGGETVQPGEEEPIVVTSGKGHEIEAEDPDIEKKPKRSQPEEEKELEESKETGSDSEEDDDGCEDWERHEALHDDVTNKERNKERVFEEEMEVVWEKGGSGLVFYTDSQYWRQKDDGDFDEQTADDWDVDMSVYYEPQGGDMDSRDFVKMRHEQRLRRGEATVDFNSATIGKFEKHTKGIGRRVMEQQGWRAGQGLGDSITGIADALDSDGQIASDKRGLGFHGEKLQRYGPPLKRSRADEGTGRITSIYDNRGETDPAEPLYRRNETYGLKSRPGDVVFLKSKTVFHPDKALKDVGKS